MEAPESLYFDDEAACPGLISSCTAQKKSCYLKELRTEEPKNRELNVDSQKHLQRQESRKKKRKSWKQKSTNRSEVIYEAAM